MFRKKEMTALEFYSRLYEITTDRLGPLRLIKADIDRGVKTKIPRHLFITTLESNEKLQRFACKQLKRLQ